MVRVERIALAGTRNSSGFACSIDDMRYSCAECANFCPGGKKCADCLVVTYCSTECQAANWGRVHRRICASLEKRPTVVSIRDAKLNTTVYTILQWGFCCPDVVQVAISRLYECSQNGEKLTQKQIRSLGAEFARVLEKLNPNLELEMRARFPGSVGISEVWMNLGGLISINVRGVTEAEVAVWKTPLPAAFAEAFAVASRENIIFEPGSWLNS